MTRVILWTLWALIPVAMIGFHLGYGRSVRESDAAGMKIRAAAEFEAQERWEEAAAAYDQALVLMKASGAGVGTELERDERMRVEIAAARAQMYAGDFVPGQERLEQLLEKTAEKPVGAEVEELLRTEVARAGYYAAWGMRLEGAGEEEWLAESGKARAQYRLLAERAESEAETTERTHHEDLEAVVRFERMTLDELKAMAPPKQCQNCKNGMCNSKRKQKQSQSPKSGQPKDAREKINQAGSSERSGKGW